MLLGHMLKKTTDTLKMTSNDRHIVTRTDFMTGLTRLDQQCNRTKTQTTEKKEKKKKPPLRIFENFCRHTFGTFAGRAFLAVEKDTAKSRTAYGKPAKEPNFPTHKRLWITIRLISCISSKTTLFLTNLDKSK